VKPSIPRIIVNAVLFTKMLYVMRIRNVFSILAFILIPLVPVMYLKLFGMNIVHGLAGALVANIVMVGLSITGDLVYYRKVLKLQDIYVASPLSPVSYVLGFAFSSLLVSLPGLIVLISLIYVVHGIGFEALSSMICVLILTWIMSTALAFMIAVRVENPIHVGSAGTVLSMFLVIFPPVYYPLQLIPYPYKYAVLIAPTTYPAHLIRLILLEVEDDPFIYWVGFIVYITVIILLALKKGRWREV